MVLEARAEHQAPRVLPSAPGQPRAPLRIHSEEFTIPHLQHHQLPRTHNHRSHSRFARYEVSPRPIGIVNRIPIDLIFNVNVDSQDGDALNAKNTDGFDLSQNTGVTIINNHIHNQDDCLAMQSSTNTVFSGNTCVGGHGISVGSIGGAARDSINTVSGLIVANNQISNSTNGIRIKTIIGEQGLV